MGKNLVLYSLDKFKEKLFIFYYYAQSTKMYDFK